MSFLHVSNAPDIEYPSAVHKADTVRIIGISGDIGRIPDAERHIILRIRLSGSVVFLAGNCEYLRPDRTQLTPVAALIADLIAFTGAYLQYDLLVISHVIAPLPQIIHSVEAEYRFHGRIDLLV